ncbi:MAG: DUF4340 domain-containing protein [Spirochaetota bacterium]
MNQALTTLKNNRALSLTLANVAIYLLAILANDPFAWFAKSYQTAPAFFASPPEAISKLSIQKTSAPEASFTLEKEGELWFVHKQGKHVADPEKIKTLLASVQNAKRFTIVTSSKDKAKDFGFGKTDELRIEAFAADKSQGYMLLGSLAGRGSYTHVRWKDENDIYLVEDNLKSSAGRGKFDDFIEKSLSPKESKAEDIVAISLNTGDSKTSYNLVLENKKWQLKSPVEKEVPASLLQSLLSKLLSIRASEVILGDEYKKLIGGSQPSELKFSTKFKNGTIPTELVILGQDKESKSYFVQKKGGNTVYKLSEYELQAIFSFDPLAEPPKN